MRRGRRRRDKGEQRRMIAPGGADQIRARMGARTRQWRRTRMRRGRRRRGKGGTTSHGRARWHGSDAGTNALTGANRAENRNADASAGRRQKAQMDTIRRAGKRNQRFESKRDGERRCNLSDGSRGSMSVAEEARRNPAKGNTERETGPRREREVAFPYRFDRNRVVCA